MTITDRIWFDMLGQGQACVVGLYATQLHAASSSDAKLLTYQIKSNQIKSDYLLRRPSSVAQGRKYKPTTTMQTIQLL